MKKLGIIGAAGGLGSTMAFHLGLAGHFEEIALFDARENVLQSHVIDLRECLSPLNRTKVYAGPWETLRGCGLVIVCAAAPPFKVTSRSDYLMASLEIIKDVALKIKTFCPEALVINVSAPVDVFTQVIARAAGLDRRRCVGFCLNDSWRFAWAVSEVLGVQAERLSALVLGEHGETQAPLYSALKLDGRPLHLNMAQRSAVQKLLDDWYPAWQALAPGRTTSWTSAVSMGKIVRAILESDDAPLPGTAIVEGEYGLSGVALGLPLRYGRDGWREIVELELAPDERERLHRSAAHIKKLGAQALAAVSSARDEASSK